MNDEMNKNKEKIQEITTEIINLKRYINELANNSQGDKLESYIDKLEKDVVKAQNKLEMLDTNSK